MDRRSLSNENWFEDFRNGSPDAFITVKNKFFNYLRLFAKNILNSDQYRFKAAESATYALLQAFRQHSVFPTAEELQKFLYVATAKHCNSILTKSPIESQSPVTFGEYGNLYLEPIVEEELLYALLTEATLKESNSLTEEQRLVFQLFFLKKKRFSEISQVTGMTIDEVRNSWTLIRSNLTFLRLSHIVNKMP